MVGKSFGSDFWCRSRATLMIAVFRGIGFEAGLFWAMWLSPVKSRFKEEASSLTSSLRMHRRCWPVANPYAPSSSEAGDCCMFPAQFVLMPSQARKKKSTDPKADARLLVGGYPG